MKSILNILFLLFSFTFLTAKEIKIKVVNKTNQLITQLDYWIGSETEAASSNLNYSSKGTLQKDIDIIIPINFHSKKRNTLLIKGVLTGGGYISQKYTISEGENLPTITLYNLATPVKSQEFKDVMDKFSSLKITNGENQSSTDNALDALIGSILIYSDSNYSTVIYKLLPTVLNTRAKKVNLPTLNRKISGIFSSETAINGALSLPFVSTSTSFQTGDVAKFTWEIEDVGEYNWFSDSGIDLAVLFTKLSPETKKILVDLYDKYPNAKMKFIDKAFVIGRLEVITSKTKKITTSIELNGANYVTASGNYMFLDDLQDKFILKNVITQVEGYDATIFLSSLYLDYKTQNNSNLTIADNLRVKSEYENLSSLYPDILTNTKDVSTIKKIFKDVSIDPNTKLNFTKKTLKEEIIDIKAIQK